MKDLNFWLFMIATMIFLLIGLFCVIYWLMLSINLLNINTVPYF
jgi:hypothetical protein